MELHHVLMIIVPILINGMKIKYKVHFHQASFLLWGDFQHKQVRATIRSVYICRVSGLISLGSNEMVRLGHQPELSSLLSSDSPGSLPYASQLFPFCSSLALQQLISSRDHGLPPHWSPQPTWNLIGWTIRSRPWVRSFGVGCSAVRRPNCLPDSLEDFLRATQTFEQHFQAPTEDKVVSQWSSFMVVKI